MNKDTIEGNWKQLMGRIQERWGRLTGDSLTEINGDRRRLAGLVQERYGVAKDDAEEQLRKCEEDQAA
jgi:uncharacterized protein YjbJ (UPF0337 family)